MVQAPFDGVITQRNVDVGALVTPAARSLSHRANRHAENLRQCAAGLFRRHQDGPTRRAYRFQSAGTRIPGRVARTANALDPSSRTLLVEVQCRIPRTYCCRECTRKWTSQCPRGPPLLVRSDAMIVRAMVRKSRWLRPDRTVHLQKIEIGRDYGDRVEVLNGVHEGDTIVANPSDAVREGLKVDVVPAAAPGK